MSQIETLFSFVNKIRSPNMITNAVFTPTSLTELQVHKQLEIIIGKRAAVICYLDERDIFRIFFYAADSDEALKEVIILLPSVNYKYSCVCDCIGKDLNLKRMRMAMEKVGFRFYARFQRMICKELPTASVWDLSQVDLAKREDMSEICNMLYSEFDPITAHFPSEKEIEKFINHEEIFVIRNSREIAGFTLFDSYEKKVAYLAYVITRPQYRKQYIARKIFLAKTLLYNKDCKYYYLWANKDSRTAIINHEKNLFFKDGTFDDIYTI